ncbi:MAG: rhomboid family intramembrane serine protease [Crocinitomicaceae bacterium]|nr:rhomboid family intramembrane serine protease [Crocinitomicaceae bacterium]
MLRNLFENMPAVTKNLLIINILLFVISLFLAQSGTGLENILEAHYFNSAFFQPYQAITHMFMHSLTDPFHIIFNMLLLVTFGSHLERVWGRKRYFIYYISCGLGAFILYNAIGAWEIMELQSELVAAGNDIEYINRLMAEGKLVSGSHLNVTFVNKLITAGDLMLPPEVQETFRTYIEYNYSSLVGASGAVFGLLAGFAMLFPNTELNLMFIPVPIKAKYLIGAYLAFEIYSSFNNSGDNIAHIAHVGGAIVGAVFVLVWKKDKSNFY